ncbi:hypothetical protein [Ruminococcus flavefaciens]|uniref:hypothetical protein n=1 Tax=Ruminococcus flavefaciens TaxID=1265 RepID=UPI0026E93D61|nr:hypothetical protein [Ruminococcus flavefaciens]
MGENMKSLAELAEEYKAQADYIKAKMDAIPINTEDYKLKHKRALLVDMYNEALSTYYRLRDYYKK